MGFCGPREKTRSSKAGSRAGPRAPTREKRATAGAGTSPAASRGGVGCPRGRPRADSWGWFPLVAAPSGPAPRAVGEEGAGRRGRPAAGLWLRERVVRLRCRSRPASVSRAWTFLGSGLLSSALRVVVASEGRYRTCGSKDRGTGREERVKRGPCEPVAVRTLLLVTSAGKERGL